VTASVVSDKQVRNKKNKYREMSTIWSELIEYCWVVIWSTPWVSRSKDYFADYDKKRVPHLLVCWQFPCKFLKFTVFQGKRTTSFHMAPPHHGAPMIVYDMHHRTMEKLIWAQSSGLLVVNSMWLVQSNVISWKQSLVLLFIVEFNTHDIFSIVKWSITLQYISWQHFSLGVISYSLRA